MYPKTKTYLDFHLFSHFLQSKVLNLDHSNFNSAPCQPASNLLRRISHHLIKISEWLLQYISCCIGRLVRHFPNAETEARWIVTPVTNYDSSVDHNV